MTAQHPHMKQFGCNKKPRDLTSTYIQQCNSTQQKRLWHCLAISSPAKPHFAGLSVRLAAGMSSSQRSADCCWLAARLICVILVHFSMQRTQCWILCMDPTLYPRTKCCGHSVADQSPKRQTASEASMSSLLFTHGIGAFNEPGTFFKE